MTISLLPDNILNSTSAASLTRRQLNIMKSLAVKDGQTIRELLTSVGVPVREACTYILYPLERLDLIVRHVDETDKRTKKVYLTQRGKSLCLTFVNKLFLDEGAEKYAHIARFFVWSDKKPKVSFSDLLPTQQSILVEMANSITRDGYTPTRRVLATKLNVDINILGAEIRDLRILGYVHFEKGCRIIRLVIHESEAS